jgi:hypothetical protein
MLIMPGHATSLVDDPMPEHHHESQLSGLRANDWTTAKLFHQLGFDADVNIAPGDR